MSWCHYRNPCAIPMCLLLTEPCWEGCWDVQNSHTCRIASIFLIWLLIVFLTKWFRSWKYLHKTGTTGWVIHGNFSLQANQEGFPSCWEKWIDFIWFKVSHGLEFKWFKVKIRVFPHALQLAEFHPQQAQGQHLWIYGCFKEGVKLKCDLLFQPSRAWFCESCFVRG